MQLHAIAFQFNKNLNVLNITNTPKYKKNPVK